MVAPPISQALALLGLFAGASIARPAADTRSCHPVSVRLPPAIKPNTPPNWVPVPLGWDFGPWFQTNSSLPSGFMRNLQFTVLPINPRQPTGPLTDLFSFQLPHNNTVITSFGIDTPTGPSLYEFAGAGLLNGTSSLLQILAWGYDCNHVGYRVSFSTVTLGSSASRPASIDVLSRVKGGPDPATLAEVQRALIAFGNPNITALAQALGPQATDNSRDGQPPILKCDAFCQSNQDLLSLV